jgi:hypothetical protein
LTKFKEFVIILTKEGGMFMDVQAILQAITTVGFPIVCCGAMMYYCKYITDRNREDIQKLNEQHKEEMSDVTTAINNNTLALQKLSDLIEYREGDNSK